MDNEKQKNEKQENNFIKENHDFSEVYHNEIGESQIRAKSNKKNKGKSKLVERNEEFVEQKEHTLTDFYELKTESVEKLVTANVENTKYIDTGEHDPYKIDRLSRVPTWIKASFVKWWFMAAMCFFFYWGLGMLISNWENMWLLMSLGTGLLTDIVLYNLFRHFQSDSLEYEPFMITPKRRWWTIFINVLYAAIVCYAIELIYHGINLFAVFVGWNEDPAKAWLGAEPLLYGIFFVLVDAVFLAIKFGITRLVRHIQIKRGKIDADEFQFSSGDTPEKKKKKKNSQSEIK